MVRKADIVVIGAGASGLMAAIAAAEKGASVILADGNAKAGRKLYATGNGRCNYTNAWIRSERPVSEVAGGAVADPPESIASETGKPEPKPGRSGNRTDRNEVAKIPDLAKADAGDRMPENSRFWKPEDRMTLSSGGAVPELVTGSPGLPVMRLDAGNPADRNRTDGSATSRQAADGWYYNRGEDGFVGDVLARFDAAAAMAFFRESGMLTRQEDEGRCYPYSGQAATVVRVLERRALEAGVMFHMEDVVTEVRWQPVREEMRREAVRAPEAGGLEEGNAAGSSQMELEIDAISVVSSSDGFLTSGSPGTGLEPEGATDRGVFVATCRSGCQLVSGALVIACGGRAGLKFGSTGDGYGFAKAFGHTLVPPRPALVPVESGDPAMPCLKGVRVRAAATLYKNGKAIAGESGEIQFTGTGLSGICVFNLTRFMEAPRPGKKKKKRPAVKSAEETAQYAIVLDLTPDIPEEKLRDFFCGNAGGYRDSVASDGVSDSSGRSHRECRMPYENMQALLSGILPESLASVIVDLAAEREAEAADVKNDGIAGNGKAAGKRHPRAVRTESVLYLLKTFPVRVSSTRGWDAAQVTAGGVRREELDSGTMQSRLKEALYFCGEVVDVDGRCGGYNLQWAWASGRTAGLAAGSKQRGVRTG